MVSAQRLGHPAALSHIRRQRVLIHDEQPKDTQENYRKDLFSPIG